MQQSDENNRIGLLEKQVEAMLFVSPQPVSSQEIASYLGVSAARIENAVKTLRDIYAKSHGLTILFVSGGWQMATLPDLADTIEAFSNAVSMQRVRLSKAALETLSVIAYNQPVTRSEIEDIRSVRCDRVVDTLMKHGLVRISGRKKSVGSPLLFRTTDRFLEIFGLAGINSLPSLDELKDYRAEDDAFDSLERTHGSADEGDNYE
ncbi:MAG: SMC-Scp complex subunit ScpB [Synergistaceae bacterium]|nr:SMC-Scp complex subunit ScpB [Synergistaceae bacterium]